MTMRRGLTMLAVLLGLGAPAAAAERPAVALVAHEELSRALEELAGQLQGLGARWREHFVPGEADAERPEVTIALAHRRELGLSPQQVDTLERIRADFQREAIRRDADVRVAESDLAALRRAEPVDLARVEAKVREAERARADLRIARIRAIEQGRAQLTDEQREKLRALAAEPRPLLPPRARAAPAR
jgi:heavy-metal resistance protein